MTCVIGRRHLKCNPCWLKNCVVILELSRREMCNSIQKGNMNQSKGFLLSVYIAVLTNLIDISKCLILRCKDSTSS